MKRWLYTISVSFYIYRLEHRTGMHHKSNTVYTVCFPALYLDTFFEHKNITT